MWHYARDGRTYHNTRTQVSADGVAWTTVFDSAVSGEYPETAAGKTHTFTAQGVRYVRDWLNGNTVNAGDHWVEIEVWGTRTTVYVGKHCEKDLNSGVVTKYYYFGGSRVAMQRGGVVYYLVGDHLGSTSLTVDSSGNKVAELRYKAYGETRYSGLPYGTPTDYRFTGQRRDGGIQLYQMGARWYDSSLARWISPDTLVPDPANPQSFNRYSYGYNNPVKFCDPSGHQACEAGDDACWERRWYQAHGYEYLEGEWLYTGNYFFADKLIFAETLVEISSGYHQINRLTAFGFTDGSVSYSLLQRGRENETSKTLGSIAFALDTIDFAITGSVAGAYTIEQLVTASVGGPPGALAGLLAGDAGYKLMNVGLLGVDTLALLTIAGADLASGMSGFNYSARQAWIGCDTLTSATTLGISAGSTALPVAPGIYTSLGGDVIQMTYDFLRAAGVLSGYSLQVQW